MLALLVALSGTSVAAPVRAAAGLITGKQVKNESLTGADIRNGTIAGIDVKKATLLKAHFKAGQIPAGPAGPKGDKGDKGDTGAAAATIVTVRTAGGSAAGPLGTSVATVNCNAGEKVVGGGSAYSRVPPGEPQVWASFPVGSPPTGWSVLLQNANSGATGSVSPVAYVICVSP
jgi:hypothetical protein